MTKELFWRKGDWAAYFGLLTNNLTNLLTMIGLLLFVVGLPKDMVLGRIAPAFGLAIMTASIAYAWFANAKAYGDKDAADAVTDAWKDMTPQQQEVAKMQTARGLNATCRWDEAMKK